MQTAHVIRGLNPLKSRIKIQLKFPLPPLCIQLNLLVCLLDPKKLQTDFNKTFTCTKHGKNSYFGHW